MLSAAEVAKFKAEGFLLGGRVISDEQIGVLLEEMQRVISGEGRKELPQSVRITNLASSAQTPMWQIINIWQASEPFHQLMFNPKVIEEVAQLTDARQLRVWHDQILYKPSATGGPLGWHQDSPYWPALAPNDVIVTAWVALDDVDEDNGCMRMIRGSYKWGDQLQFLQTIQDFYNLPKEFNGREIEVRMCPVPKGHVHFHHSLTCHGSGQNKSGRPRRAIALHYMTERCVYVEAGQSPMKSFIKVADGAMLEGDIFPLVWEKANKEPAHV